MPIKQFKNILIGGGVLAAIVAGMLQIFSDDIRRYFNFDEDLKISYDHIIDEEYITSCGNEDVFIERVEPRNTNSFKYGECVYVMFVLTGHTINSLGAVDIKLNADLLNDENKVVDKGEGIYSISDPLDWVSDDTINDVRVSLIDKYNLRMDGSTILKIKGFVQEEKFFTGDHYRLRLTAIDTYNGKKDSFVVPLFLERTAGTKQH